MDAFEGVAGLIIHTVPHDAKTIREAEGFVDLGLPLDVWEVLETLPPSVMVRADVLAVRLKICKAMER